MKSEKIKCPRQYLREKDGNTLEPIGSMRECEMQPVLTATSSRQRRRVWEKRRKKMKETKPVVGRRKSRGLRMPN